MSIYHLPFKDPANSLYRLGGSYAVCLSTDSKMLPPDEVSGYMVFRDIDGKDRSLPFKLSYTGSNAEIHACMDLVKFTSLLIDYTNTAITMLAETEKTELTHPVIIHSIAGSLYDVSRPITYH